MIPLRFLPLAAAFPLTALACDLERAAPPSTAEAVVPAQVPAPPEPPLAREAPPKDDGPAERELGVGASSETTAPEPVATAAPASVPTAWTASSAAAGPTATSPRWLVTSSGPGRGEMVLRCEGTRDHPTDVAGGCTCGASVLNPCSEEAQKRIVDRRQCGFTCAPRSGSTFALRCPDGGKPAATPGGCACGDQVLDPCAGNAPRTVVVRGDACSVTCP
jgi:hypothetical protein